MQLTIKIAIDSREFVNVFCSNCGSPAGDRKNPTRIYHYVATHPELNITTEGYILHKWTEGIEKLAALILDDLTHKIKFYKQN